VSSASNNPASGARRSFATTRWSLVLHAREDSAGAHAALSTLCRDYWYPLYAYVRRQGSSPHDAQDLTQEFFARLIEKGWLDAVVRERGRFRSFLLAAMKHFLANERDKAQAQKRGGGVVWLSIDDATAEGRYREEPIDTATAEKLFERRWACTLLEQVLARLREEMVEAGKGAQFEMLKGFLAGEKSRHAEIAAQLGMTEGAVKVAVHRLRDRYRALIRTEIAQTVAHPSEIDDELQHLFAALSG
jgi:RNA polymerase sigma-70 factor (ECF subfamily)